MPEGLRAVAVVTGRRSYSFNNNTGQGSLLRVRRHQRGAAGSLLGNTADPAHFLLACSNVGPGAWRSKWRDPRHACTLFGQGLLLVEVKQLICRFMATQGSTSTYDG